MMCKMSVLLLLPLILMSLGIPCQGSPIPVEVGVKVPLAGLLTVRLSEQLSLETSAVIPGFSAPLVEFESRLAAKLYPGQIVLGNLPMRPFVGGGALFLYAVGELVPGLAGLAGLEYASPALPLVVFLEGSVAFLQGEGLGKPKLELSLGARFAFPP